jgi:threonine/homoserine/homoserine lactone efflux protein
MSGSNFAIFIFAALLVAAIPGPGMFYVTARTLAGGRSAGMASTFGTGLGGLVHIIVGSIGLSALLLASAQLFTTVKFAGALYLIWLGLQTFRSANSFQSVPAPAIGIGHAFRDGILVEALNPKTAAFFLAFLPQFITPASAHPGLQFIVLGVISVVLNTLADVIAVMAASAVRRNLAARPSVLRRLRQGSGLFMAGLGVSLALARRPVRS